MVGSLAKQFPAKPALQCGSNVIDGLLVGFFVTQNVVMSKSTSDILPLFQDPQATFQDLIFFPNTLIEYLVT